MFAARPVPPIRRSHVPANATRRDAPMPFSEKAQARRRSAGGAQKDCAGSAVRGLRVAMRVICLMMPSSRCLRDALERRADARR